MDTDRLTPYHCDGCGLDVGVDEEHTILSPGFWLACSECGRRLRRVVEEHHG